MTRPTSATVAGTPPGPPPPGPPQPPRPPPGAAPPGPPTTAVAVVAAAVGAHAATAVVGDPRERRVLDAGEHQVVDVPAVHGRGGVGAEAEAQHHRLAGQLRAEVEADRVVLRERGVAGHERGRARAE